MSLSPAISSSPLSNLVDAIRIIKNTRVSAAGGSDVVWNKLYNAALYLEDQVKAQLAE
jgi:hypothetical protein